MQKALVSILLSVLIGQAYADFLPDEPPAPAMPSTQAGSNVMPDTNLAKTPVAQAWVISIPSTPTSAPQQVEILRKGGLPAYTGKQGNQTLVWVGPNLEKGDLLQQQKIVLELLNTPGSIVPYQISLS